MALQTDIEVLKSEVQGLYRAVTDVGLKLDMLLALQVQLGRLQEQHDNTKLGLDRAFQNLRAVTGVSNDTADKLDRTLAFVRGGAAVGVILFGFAQWYVLQQLGRLQDIAKYAENFNLRVTLIERKIWPDKE